MALIFVDSNSHPFAFKVGEIKVPLGGENQPCPAYNFDYHFPEEGGGACGVKDAHKVKTDYCWDEEQRLKEITRFYGNGLPFTYDRLFFGKEKTPDHGNIISRTFSCGAKPLFCRYYTYDEAGNIINEKLHGHISGNEALYKANPLKIDENGSPNSREMHEKSYTYYDDGRNLLRSEIEGSRSKEYVYHPKTDLVGAILTKSHDQIVEREFFNYDEDTKALVLEIVDNGCTDNPDVYTGVTYRKIREIEPSRGMPWGVPLIVKESCLDISTGQPVLEKRIVNHYIPQGNLIRQDHYDSHNAWAYSLLWNYDLKGNLIYERNAIGQEIFREYDANGNLISEKGPNPHFEKRLTYYASNCLKSVEERHDDGTIFTTEYRYDRLNRKTATIDHYGNETRYEYDEFGRMTKMTAPTVLDENGNAVNPVTTFTYDALGNRTSVTDPRGNITFINCTIKGKPYEIRHPDGTFECFQYYLHGPVSWQRERHGCHAHYFCDYQDRITQTNYNNPQGNLLWSTQTIYDAFKPIQEIDKQGSATTFHYDAFGRKTATEKGDRVENFEYDALGRITRQWTSYGFEPHEVFGKLYAYDLLGRVIDEATIDYFGNVYQRITFAYDYQGNVKEQTTFGEEGEQITHTRYTSYGIASSTIDTLGNETKTTLHVHINELGQRVPCLETTDPNGNVTTIIKDALGRERHYIRKNALGDIIQQRETLYDQSNNRCKVIETIFSPNSAPTQVIQAWTYDCMNNVTSCTEAFGTPEQKQTHYLYNCNGQLESIVKPSGVCINHVYFPEGYLERYWASDDSFSYRYEYNINGDMVRCWDKNSCTHRNYDIYGNMTFEELSTGFKMHYTYDRANRLGSLTLPDQSSIHYQYDSPVLKNVARCSPSGEIYRHVFNSYDLSLKPISQTLLAGAGQLTTSFDRKGRSKSMHSEHIQECIPENGFDGCDNLLTRQLIYSDQTTDCRYTYDDCHQLTSESSPTPHNYLFDSHYNRVSKDDSSINVNSLNQIVDYAYDLDGNLIHDGLAQYSFDALNRLISVTKDGVTTTYTYDNFNRRLTKTTPNETLYFLYHDQNEIGAANSAKVLTQFRVLSHQGQGAERGSTVAIELNGRPYAPIHDLSGNVIALLDQHGTLIETYRYTAFGEELNESSLGNPWRYASKRTDEESSLVYFGRRYYSPRLGRWITQDPLGYDAGPNLYAYVSNNPLTHIDAYGLFELPEFCSWDSLGSAGYSAYNFALDGFSNAINGLAENRLARNLGGWMVLEDFPEFRDEQISFYQESYGRQSFLQNLIQDAGDAIDLACLAYQGPVKYLCMEAFPVASLAKGSVKLGMSKASSLLAGKSASEIVKSAGLNRFNQAALNATEQAQNNIRVLRNWAKSKGWRKTNNIDGGPEVWGKYVEGKFEWNLKIKPEGSLREGLEAQALSPGLMLD